MAKRKKKKNSSVDMSIDPDVRRGIFVILLVVFGIFTILSILGLALVAGDFWISLLTLLFGWGRFIAPIVFLFLAYYIYKSVELELNIINYIGIVLFIVTFHALLHVWIPVERTSIALAEGYGGGYLGWIISMPLLKFMGFWAAFVVLFAFFVISIIITFDYTLEDILESGFLGGFGLMVLRLLGRSHNEEEMEDDEESEEEEEEVEYEEDDEEVEEDDEEEEEEEMEEDDEGEEDDVEEEEGDESTTDYLKVVEDLDVEYTNPYKGIELDIPLNLLNAKKEKPTSGDIKTTQEKIQKTLENFNIEVEMGEVSVGPTVTQYTLKPAQGVKIARITALQNDIALAIAAHPIRIEAPIPGKSLIGIEVPNKSVAMVGLKEILSSEAFKDADAELSMAVGKDVAGNPWVSRLDKMPHVLVAGSTGSGKSVCLNSLIISLLYKNSPETLRFVMVDPKRVELTMYKNLPHLLTPVITDVKKTVNALKWALSEMDRRYQLLAEVGKRNIADFNEVSEHKMPYIVIIIDELADLMVAAASEIETSIIRLAQMARAVGIHLVLATQRPSVDVITGLIKANVPARIAFSVASVTDSRTILDMAGADKLVGRGDMLFSTADVSKPIRLQGPFVSDLEIKKVVRYIKDELGRPEFDESVVERQSSKGGGGSFDYDADAEEDDELYEDAKAEVIRAGKASASFLQRRLKVGYARAARLLDILEEKGIVGPSQGAKPREVYVSKSEPKAEEEEYEDQPDTGQEYEDSDEEEYEDDE